MPRRWLAETRPDFSNEDEWLKRRKAQIARILGGEFLRSVEALEWRLDREAQQKREKRDRRMAWARRGDLLVNGGGGHYTKPIAEIDGILRRPDIDPRTGYQRGRDLDRPHGSAGPLPQPARPHPDLAPYQRTDGQVLYRPPNRF